MLYHVTDLDRGLSELARVLEAGGRLVAVTNADDHLRELRDLIGADFHSGFTRESGEGALLRHFASVERTDLDGTVTIADAEAVYAYRDSMLTSDTTREFVFDVPFRARTGASIFVATR
jgi:SAM-dependent methyltransferase